MDNFHMSNHSRNSRSSFYGGFIGLVLATAYYFGPIDQADAQVTIPDPVETTTLAADAFATGTLERRDGALTPDLWRGAKPETLNFLLALVPSRPALPAIGEALKRTLLSAGTSPADIGNPIITQSLGGQKVLALVNAGFIEEARTIVSLSNAAPTDPYAGKSIAVADLLLRRENEACARGAALTTARDEIFWAKLRIFCYMLADERDAADLTLDILRDRGALSPREEEILTALITGLPPKDVFRPENALELAIIRQLNMPLVPGLFNAADGAVIKAIALDDSLDDATRIEAARRAVAMGIMDTEVYGELLASIPLDIELVGNAAGIVQNDPSDPLTDAVVYQAIIAMSAPEFLRDKAAFIADVLSASQNTGHFHQAFAWHALYAPEINVLEGAIVPPAHAGHYARAQMIAGDGDRAGRWLFAMKGEENILALGDDLAEEFITLTSLLALLDPVTANIVADSADIALIDLGQEHTNKEEIDVISYDAVLSAQITEAVFDAAMGDEKGRKKIGQAALSALALTTGSGMATAGRTSGVNTQYSHPIQRVVMDQALRLAGLEDIKRNLAFQAAWRAMLPDPQSVPRKALIKQEDDGLTPSLKPSRRN